MTPSDLIYDVADHVLADVRSETKKLEQFVGRNTKDARNRVKNDVLGAVATVAPVAVGGAVLLGSLIPNVTPRAKPGPAPVPASKSPTYLPYILVAAVVALAVLK